MLMLDPAAIKDSGLKLIEFRDVTKNYQPMFYLEDGKDLTVRTGVGEYVTLPCRYIDSHHFYFGSECFHIDQFAELNQRNGNVCEPPAPITDLSLFVKQYMDRSLLGEDGKPIPYRALVGFDPDYYGPTVALGICPEASADRQVCLRTRSEVQGKVFVDYRFASFAGAMNDFLPQLPLSRYEQKLVAAVFEAQARQMERKSLAQQISGAESRRGNGHNSKEQPVPER